MNLKDFLLKGSEWSQADHVKKFPSAVRSGICRSLVAYWLCDCISRQKVTVASNFKLLIKIHEGNLGTMASTQEKTSKGDFNGLDRTAITITEVSKGSVRVLTNCGGAWHKGGSKMPVPVMNSALNGSTAVIRSSILHLEWDGFLGFGGGAHAIGVVREDQTGSTGNTYTIFDPNYGLLLAYSTGNSNITDLLNAIISEYSVDRFLAMALS